MTENESQTGNENRPGNDNRQTNDSQFDWVTRRAACSLPKVFIDLRSQIEQDVKTRNSLRPGLAPYEFSIADVDYGFKVLLTAKDLVMSVTFTLADHAIQVRADQGLAQESNRAQASDQTDQTNRTNDKSSLQAAAKSKPVQIMEITLAFNDHGECKLRVDGQDREPWQVRRLALENLMFHAN